MNVVTNIFRTSIENKHQYKNDEDARIFVICQDFSRVVFISVGIDHKIIDLKMTIVML